MKHLIHPGHSLAEVYGSEEFQCDGCKTPGNGPRFRCHACDFNLHDYCGRCPFILFTFMHPQHHLELVIGTQGRHDNESSCDLCGDNVEGMFYRCKLCDFNIHPVCTKLPEDVPHALHPIHQLKLQKSSHGRCSVCKIECTSWRYGCRACSFDIHLECILTRCDESTASRSVAAPATPHGDAARLLPWGWGCSGQTLHGAYVPPPHGAYGPAPYGAYGPPPMLVMGPLYTTCGPSILLVHQRHLLITQQDHHQLTSVPMFILMPLLHHRPLMVLHHHHLLLVLILTGNLLVSVHIV